MTNQLKKLVSFHRLHIKALATLSGIFEHPIGENIQVPSVSIPTIELELWKTLSLAARTCPSDLTRFFPMSEYLVRRLANVTREEMTQLLALSVLSFKPLLSEKKLFELFESASNSTSHISSFSNPDLFLFKQCYWTTAISVASQDTLTCCRIFGYTRSFAEHLAYCSPLTLCRFINSTEHTFTFSCPEKYIIDSLKESLSTEEQIYNGLIKTQLSAQPAFTAQR